MNNILSHKIKTEGLSEKLSPNIRKRWSIRSFADKPLLDDDMHLLFEAARWSASSMNEQPWKFIYAHKQDPDAFNRLFDCLVPGNREWCKDAAVLVLSLAKRNFNSNGNSNRHAMHDVGAANAALLLQAADLDIFGHLLGGFDMQKTIETFKIDANQWEVACFISLGYADVPEKLEEPFKTREISPRSRKPLEEVVERIM